MVVSRKGRLQVAREATRRCRVEGRVDWPVQFPGPDRRHQHQTCPLQHIMYTRYMLVVYIILGGTLCMLHASNFSKYFYKSVVVNKLRTHSRTLTNSLAVTFFTIYFSLFSPHCLCI